MTTSPQRHVATAATRASVGIGFATLRANPLRTFLSTLGIVMGAAALAAVLAMSDGVEAFARAQIESTTDLQTIVIQPERFERIDGLRVPLADPVHPNVDDARGLNERVGALGTATLQVQGSLVLETAERRRAVLLHGFSSTPAQIHEQPLAAGALPTEAAWMKDTPQLVISNALATLLADSAPPASLIGTEVAFTEGPVTIAAVAEAQDGDGDMLVAAAPFPAAERLLAGHDPTPQATILLRTHRVEDVLVLRDSAMTWLAEQPGDWSEKVRVMVMQDHLVQVQQGMLIFKLLMGSFTGIALVVGGIGIMNVLLAAVAERTREIGIRKAVGARQIHIVTQFLSESVTIAIVGSFVGVVLGLSAAAIVSAVMRVQTDAAVYPALSAGSITVSAMAAVVVGIIFGTYPALRAARLDPIDALRHD